MKLLTYKNYLEVIKKSEKSEMFRSLWVKDQGEEKDILKDGQIACAYYVSSILKIFDLISNPHATVSGTVRDMINSGWRETNELKIGNVLVWEEKEFENGERHTHIGFYLGDDKAISNSDELGVPKIHHYTEGKTEKDEPKRKIEKIITYPFIIK